MTPSCIGLISGWAHDADCMSMLAKRLATTCPVKQACVGDWSQDHVNGLLNWVEGFSKGQGIVLIGWSMAALLILDALCSRPLADIKAVVLISGTARFTATTDYPHGCAAGQLRAMQRDLKVKPEATLRDFFTLAAQPQRPAHGQEALVTSAMAQGLPALNAGLTYLSETDVRDKLDRLHCPVLCWHGAQDQVIPMSASKWLATALPKGSLIVHPDAGHTAPSTHADDLYAAITGFMTALPS